MASDLGKNKRRARNTYVNKPSRKRFVLKKPSFAIFGSPRRFLSTFLVSCFCIALFLGICLGTLKVYGLITTSSFFETKHVSVMGNARLTRESVLKLAGLRLGENALSMNIAQAERRLIENPWIVGASVKRILPDRFILKVEERVPFFWVRREKKLYYAGEQGDVIAPVEGANFISLPMLDIAKGSGDWAQSLAACLYEIQHGGLPAAFASIGAIRVRPGQVLEFDVADRDLRLTISSTDWQKNLKKIRQTLQDLARRKEIGNVREIRSADDKVWVIMNGVP